MTGKPLPEQFYQQQIKSLGEELTILLKRKSRLGWLRLVVLLVTAFTCWQLLVASLFIVFLVFVTGLILFLYVVKKDLVNNDLIEHKERLLHINKEELNYLNYQYTHQKDGASFYKEDHAYAGDLDLFGRASVYQFINRTTSEQGNKRLAQWLKQPSTANVIVARQQAIKELSTITYWRQELQSIGSAITISKATENKLVAWLTERNQFIDKMYWQLLRFIMPAITITTLACYVLDILSYQQFLQALLVFVVIAFGISRRIMPLYKQLSHVAAETETLSNSIACIEKAPFNDPLLKQLQQSFYKDNTKASQRIFQLKKIFNRFEYRLNFIVFIPLNTFLLWDLQQVLQLEQWKKKNNSQFQDWFHSLAELEAISSLGTLAFNHPNWCFPVIATDETIFTAVELGHPLIDPKKNILNNFATTGQQQINLITGSNMAGKSTFLRSVGVNMVLACMGAPVCAKELKATPLKIMSSMRIKDNLEESTSTFYAELKKLKQIIDAVNNHESVFVLLDEILRGTNSNDRHTGSKALIKQLLQQQATGLLATHDLELANLSTEYPLNIHNYHFDVQVNGEELFFDYKLKRGICQSMNASILMKKIGIEL